MIRPVLTDEDQQNRERINFKLEAKTTANLIAETSVEGNIKYDSTLKKAAVRTDVGYKALAASEDLQLFTKVFPGWDCCTIPVAGDVVITNSGATQTIALLTINGAAISVSNTAIYYTDGAGVSERHVITAPITGTWTKTNGIWVAYFNNSGNFVVEQGNFPDFALITPLYRFYYNVDDDLVNTRTLEFHPNDISASDHAHKHKLGAIWYSGFDLIHNELATGSPSATGLNTCVSITPGANMDDNLKYSIANSYPDAATARLSQNLGIQTSGSLTISNAGLFKISYNDSNGRLKVLPATRFPFKWNASTNIPQYITAAGVATDVPSGNWFVYFLYALQDDEPGEALRLRSAVVPFATSAAADAYSWEQAKIDSITLQDNEIRSLSKLKFQTVRSGGQAYDAAVKYSVLRQKTDIRTIPMTTLSTSSSIVTSANVVLSTTPVGSSSTTSDDLMNETYNKLTGVRVVTGTTDTILAVDSSVVYNSSTDVTVSALLTPTGDMKFNVTNIGAGKVTINSIIVSKNQSVEFKFDITANAWYSQLISQNYSSEFVTVATGTATLTLKNSTSTYLQSSLTNANSALTIALPTPIKGVVNESILTLVIGATLPTITLPASINWLGYAPGLAINSKYVICFEQKEIADNSFETWAQFRKKA